MEQKFYEEKVKKDAEINEMLKQISDGLDDIKQQAVDIGSNLDYQDNLIKEVATKTDATNENIVNSNQKIKNLLKRDATCWCPVVVCIIILLGVIGYIINITL
jgi:hypothetical protein